MTLHHLAGFYVPWSAALAASASEPVKVSAPVLQIAGLDLPLVQVVLAIAGVLLARPLAPRRKQERGWLQQLSVTAIMTIVAVAWAVEERPGALFTFVVAIGLGFSGYALIQTAGEQVEAMGRRVLASITAAIDSFGGKPK
jgi:hypothetical protein